MHAAPDLEVRYTRHHDPLKNTTVAEGGKQVTEKAIENVKHHMLAIS